jgi:hypothetical protein
MVTLEELRRKVDEIPDFCRTELAPKVHEFETHHQVDLSQLKEGVSTWGIPLLGCILIAIAFNKSVNVNLQIVGGIAALGALICGWFSSKGLRSIMRTYLKRLEAMRQLFIDFKTQAIRYLDPSFRYQPSTQFPAAVYKSCGLFPSSYDTSSAEDHVVGTLDKTQFELQEIKTHKKETYRDSEGRTKTRYVPIFRGILFMADFNKNFLGQTVIETDVSEKKFGVLGRTAQRIMGTVSDRKLVELENPDFERHYKVSSSDPTEARYLLTPTFMEALIRLKDKYGQNVQVAFLNSTIIIAIPHSSGFMEVGMNLDQLSQGLEKFGHELLDMLEIIEDLELNNRIWNKNPNQAGA